MAFCACALHWRYSLKNMEKAPRPLLKERSVVEYPMLSANGIWTQKSVSFVAPMMQCHSTSTHKPSRDVTTHIGTHQQYTVHNTNTNTPTHQNKHNTNILQYHSDHFRVVVRARTLNGLDTLNFSSSV